MNFQRNISFVFLLVVYFFIYTAFLHVQVNIQAGSLVSSFPKYTNVLLVAIESSSVLLIGLLATFVFPVYFLLIISLSSLMIGISFFTAVAFLNNTKDIQLRLNLGGIIMFGIFYGTFRLLLLCMILDQEQSHFIKRKIIGWLGVINFSFILVYMIPSPIQHPNLMLFPVSFSIIGIILLFFGKFRKIYAVDSNIVNVFQLMKRFNWSEELLISEADINDSERNLISISKSIIFFFLLIPYGICDSQTRFAYQYQSNHMKIPNWNGSLSSLTRKSNFWPITLNCLTVILAYFVLILLKEMNKSQFIQMLFSSIKLQIITGNILMILSTTIGGILELFRLNIYWSYDPKARIPSIYSFNQTIGNITYKAADLTVFAMVPQIVLDGISEVIITTTCIEFMYKQSKKSIKYLGIALFLAADGSGGFSDLFFTIYTFYHESLENDLNNCHLDYIYFGLAGVAFFSWIISIILINRFPHRFTIVQSQKNYES
uniref:Slc15a-8 n=1 Tax=Schmidtea mediterranea TaxID=79327 RepID=A0A0H3YJ38_SCHMD|nr:slc15a-8 [Schmidtea mediterranea]